MAKRVSMKGKGAELFFSGDLNPVPTQETNGHHSDATAADIEPLRVTIPVEEPPSIQAETPSDEPDTSRAPAPDHKPTRARSNTGASVAGGALHHPQPDVIELIRKTVKTPGREVSFVRLTPEEKGRLVDVVYTYKRQGVKTSENEINRIAVHYMLHDYYEHGEASILAQVIAALRA